MTKENILELWDYYMMLDDNLDQTSRYVEPKNQENIYSLEFAKLLVLSCTEVESVFKMLCTSIDCSQNPGKIDEYKRVILGRYPHFEDNKVNVPKLGRIIKPFEHWNNCQLPWWKAYQKVKHYRSNNFTLATYINACTALSALHLLLLYLGRSEEIDVNDLQGNYINNPYIRTRVLTVNTEAEEWPD